MGIISFNKNHVGYSKNKVKIISLLLIALSLFLLTGCSNRARDDDLIIRGQVKIAGLDGIQFIASRPNITDITNWININTVPEEPALYNPGEYIVKFTKNLTVKYIDEEILKGYGKTLRKIAGNTYKIKITSSEKFNLIDSLANNPLISYIEPDYLVHIQDYTVPNDPGYSQQWNLKMLGLSRTWNSYQGSNNVVVAVVDTGILPGHPDLKDNLVPGYDFVDNDNDPTDTDPNFSHGTHVAGIIGAVTNNREGIAGINWHVRIMPVRVIGPGGSGGYSALISGIREAVDRGADVINLSLAGEVDSPSLHDAVKYAVAKGVTVVAAAGNNNSTPILYPARYPEVISVGAIGPTKERAYYSNYGPNLDLVAPGGDSSVFSAEINSILSTAGYMESTGPVHQYTYAQGTSMAAPHVSGLVALLYSAGITDPEDIKDLLKRTADDLGPAGEDDWYGAGLVNINRALGLDNYGQPSPMPGSDNNDSLDQAQLLGQVKILAAREEEGNKVGKTTTTTDSNGRFNLKLSPGTWTISGWLDINGNEEIDAGDYYGAVENIQINRDSVDEIITLELTKLIK
ncbi:MAG: serine protease [Halanaerobiales bacterium]|nr:serine protease [Halanaerobiales bacterium]